MNFLSYPIDSDEWRMLLKELGGTAATLHLMGSQETNDAYTALVSEILTVDKELKRIDALLTNDEMPTDAKGDPITDVDRHAREEWTRLVNKHRETLVNSMRSDLGLKPIKLPNYQAGVLTSP